MEVSAGPLKSAMRQPVVVCGLIVAASLLALATVYTAQYAFKLVPCPLCLAQRVPYALTTLLGLAGLALRQRLKIPAGCAFLCALCFLAGSFIAFYHNGVEQHWWESFLEGCKVTFTADNAKTLLQQIEAAAPSHCDEIPWSDPVLHLSMAAWNIVASLALAVWSFAGSIFIVRRANGF